MTRVERGVAFLGNLAFVAIAVVFVLVAVQRWSGAGTQDVDTSQLAPPPGTPVHYLAPSGSAAVPTLIVGLSTACAFCEASVPFYQSLVQLDDVVEGRVRLVVASFQGVEEMRAYLDDHDLRILDIAEVEANEIPIRVTPTLLLVDRAGVVTASWAGRLPASRELEVKAAIIQAAKT